MRKNWKDSLRDRDISEIGPLYRHELSYVGASTVAQQFYCEAKVDNEYTMGEVPAKVKDVGTGLHDEIFEMERVDRENLIEHIERAPSLTASFRLYAEIGDLRLAGVPDAVIFKRGKPRWVIELKTTRGDVSRLWPDQEIQVRIYGLLLERMGFDCSNLDLALIRMRQEHVLASSEKEALLSLIGIALQKQKTSQLEARFGVKFFLMPHAGGKAEDAIAWASDYWLQKREAIPTKNQGKCRACEYNASCAHSLLKFN